MAKGAGYMDEAKIRVASRIIRLTAVPSAMKQKECVWEMKLQ